MPRANRGIFAINELPDLAGKFKSASSTSCRRADVQIKLSGASALDVMLFSLANPKITRRAEDHHAAQRPHRLRNCDSLSAALQLGVEITRQESWTARGTDGEEMWSRLHVPDFIRETVEQIAFEARDDQRIDSARASRALPISALDRSSPTPSGGRC